MSDDTRERLSRAARDGSAPPNGSDGNQTMMQPDGHLDAEMMSAWLDTPEDFNEQDRLAIERHLATCSECQMVAAELTAIVRAFQTLPLVEAPLSFALTREMAGLTATPTLPSSRQLEEPANLYERQRERQARQPVASYSRARRLERQMSALRWATAVATLLFVFFVSVDLLGNIDTSGDDDDSASFTTAAEPQQTETVPMSAAGVQATEASGGEAEAVQPTTASGDTARNSAPEPTSTSAASAADESSGGGSEPESTPASAGAQAATEQEATEEQVPMALSEATPTPTAEHATTMSQLAPTETIQGYAADQDSTTSAINGNGTVEENPESSTLHLIELALVILIAWLIVALIALPRLRRVE